MCPDKMKAMIEQKSILHGITSPSLCTYIRIFVYVCIYVHQILNLSRYTWIFQMCKMCAFSPKKPTKRQMFLHIFQRSRYTQWALAWWIRIIPQLLRLCLAHWGTQYTDAIDDNHRGTWCEYSRFRSWEFLRDMLAWDIPGLYKNAKRFFFCGFPTQKTRDQLANLYLTRSLAFQGLDN